MAAAAFRSILVPHDGSRLSAKAVKVAVRLARSLKGRISVLHVIEPYLPPRGAEGMMLYAEAFSPQEYKKATERAARNILRKVKAEAARAGVACAGTFVTSPAPWEAIVRTAKSSRCDLIVMASHGRRGLAAILLGSETAKVLTHSRIPVLVCR